MSIADTLIRLLPSPDYERMRHELLLALEEGEWRNVLDVSRAVRHNPRGDFRGGPGTLFTTLIKLEDEGLVETRGENVGLTGYESRRMIRLTEYGRSELREIGAANV